jgi:hypothetical protein
MLLSHQRAMLTKIFDMIHLRNPVARTTNHRRILRGRMKQECLKETETKQIVLATFSMAAEALDIKTYRSSWSRLKPT